MERIWKCKGWILSFIWLTVSSCVSAQYSARKFVVNLTADGQSCMFCYLPQNPTGRAVVDCPGGGYTHLAIQPEGHDWAGFFNEKGIALFVLQYRMPNGDRTIPLSDAYKAMRTVRDSAAVWHVNPDDVGIMGFSAGGHLASTVCTHAEYAVRPNFSILFYPVISMNPKKGHAGSCLSFLGEDGVKNKKLVAEYSSDKAVQRHITPRSVVLLANDDRAVPPVTNGVAYYSAMRNAGNECSMYIYPTGGHGFGFRNTWAFHDQMLSDLSRWLDSFAAPRTDAVRVACIGNSITDGYGVDMADTKGYPAVLQRKLGNGYWVRNYGVGARTMMDCGDLPYMNELAWRDALAFRPDIAIVKLGTNDSKRDIWKHGADKYAQSMQRMIDSLKALPSKPKIYLCSPIPAFKSPWTMSDSVIVNGEIPVIKRLAKKNKCSFIDLHTLFIYRDLMLDDGIHPNGKGAAKIAEIVYEALTRLSHADVPKCQ